LGEPKVVGGVNPNPTSTASAGHANGVLNHISYNNPDNGLCGCTGVKKDQWKKYFKNFNKKERGKLVVIRSPNIDNPSPQYFDSPY
jgi:hypothetical protein